MVRSQGIFPVHSVGEERTPHSRLTRGARRRHGLAQQVDEVSRCLNAMAASRAECAMRPVAHCGDISGSRLQGKVREELPSQMDSLEGVSLQQERSARSSSRTMIIKWLRMLHSGRTTPLGYGISERGQCQNRF